MDGTCARRIVDLGLDPRLRALRPRLEPRRARERDLPGLRRLSEQVQPRFSMILGTPCAVTMHPPH